MKVLVTGATSLIGTGVVRSLVASGHEVTTFQRRPAGLDTTEVLGDLTDVDTVTRATEGMDAVIHLAALVSVVGAWPAFEAVNVQGTANVVTAARQAGVSRFVHISSPSVAHHGSSLTGVGAGAADPHRARGHYARSKAMAEQLALTPTSGGGMAVVALRPHLVLGPGDTQLVGRIVERAGGGHLPLIGQGAALIDTTYVDNAVDAIVAALDRAPNLDGRAFVVSNGQPRTVRELLTRICRAAGLEPPRFHHLPFPVARAGGAVAERVWNRLERDDVPPMTTVLAEQLGTAHWFDQRETRDALGWRPRVSLDEGFDRLAAWYADR